MKSLPLLADIFFSLSFRFCSRRQIRTQRRDHEEGTDSCYRVATCRSFARRDYEKAHGLAAAGIQKQFSREAFEKMVKNGYPVIANSKSVRFGLIMDNGKEAVVIANIRGNGKQSAQYR